jgi:hypothetical protein
MVWLCLANEEMTFPPNYFSLTGVVGHLKKLRMYEGTKVKLQGIFTQPN